jgi:hypothetical protein
MTTGPNMDTGNEPQRLMTLMELARQLDLETFAARVGGPVLLRQQPIEDGDDGWSFKTAPRLSTVVNSIPGRELVVHSDDIVHVVRKAHAGAAFSKTILIGRADSNDIRLPHPSVSKLHARIQLDSRGQFVLSDAGSQNGTELDGRRLDARQSVELGDGAWIRTGDLTMCFLSVERLYEVLRRIR